MQRTARLGVSRMRFAEMRDGYVFILPQMILFAVFTVIPVFEGVRISLYDSSFMGDFFVGFENYRTLLTDPVFLKAVLNTLVYVVSVTALTVGLGFLIAAAIFDKNPKYVSFIRCCYYLPTIIGMAVLSLIWLWLLNPSYGLINYYLQRLGIAPINFVGDARTRIPVIIFMIWLVNIGQSVMLLVASMSSIPNEMFEAADIDGASRFQQIRYIVAPLSKSTVVYLTILMIISVIKVFSVIHLMTAGGPNYATVSMMYLSYLEAFKFFDYGTGSAIGVIMFIIVWALSMVILAVTSKKE